MGLRMCEEKVSTVFDSRTLSPFTTRRRRRRHRLDCSSPSSPSPSLAASVVLRQVHSLRDENSELRRALEKAAQRAKRREKELREQQHSSERAREAEWEAAQVTDSQA